MRDSHMTMVGLRDSSAMKSRVGESELSCLQLALSGANLGNQGVIITLTINVTWNFIQRNR